MRYQFKTVSQSGDAFLWTYREDELIDAQFAHSNLRSHGEYGFVHPIEINLTDQAQLGLIYLGKEKCK